MQPNKLKSRLLRRSLVATAAGLCLASAVMAQQTVGSVNGRANKGDVVTVESKEIGVTRQVRLDADGTFQISQLPPGTYTVTRTRANGSTETTLVSVSAGEGSTASFATAQRIEITGSAIRTIDARATESATTLSKVEIDRIPVARNVTAVTLLAPGAVFGDSRIGQTTARAGNVPSLGGASPAENAYYVNGFNVTNILNGVAFNQVPFEGIAELQVKTGGYGAEFGRSLGGVVTVTTKRGTNEWTGGVSAAYIPESLRGSSVYTERNPTSLEWELKNRPGGRDEFTYSVFGGGPIIKDKLFVFGLFQGGKLTSEVFGNNSQTKLTNSTPQYLLKVDWNVTDNNFFELTAFSDKSKDKTDLWNSPTPYAEPKGAFIGPSTAESGGTNVVGKWTSLITEDLSVSALYGSGKYSRSESAANSDCPYVIDQSTGVARRGAGACYVTANIPEPTNGDERTAFRLDAEWILGKHRLKAGLDRETIKVSDGSKRSGGIEYRLLTRAGGAILNSNYTVPAGTPATVYVRTRQFANGGAFDTINSAWYLEDTIDITSTLVATVGIRNESFNNKNAAGVDFINIKNTWAPRFGVAWDVNGDASLKVYGNAGRYYIPVMANTNVRLSGAETDIQEWFPYAGTNGAQGVPNVIGAGAPLGGTQVVSNGVAPNPLSVVDPNIKPLFQDEFIVGFQKALADRWSFGVKGTYRALQNGMDDICNDEGPTIWATANGYTPAQAANIGAAIGHCFLYNPGKNLTANIDLDSTGTLTQIVIPAAALQMPEPKRTYKAIELTFERAWDKKWSFKGSYVLSYNEGNTEGYVKSDIGQDDAGISQDFDYPGLAEGSFGYLPNDRRHTLKAAGSFAVTDEWRLGGNVIAQSGRPKNCFGVYGGTTDTVSPLYGDASFYCDGVLRSRGFFGRLPWTTQLDLQATYTPAQIKGLTLSVDVLNVFNRRTVRGIDEQESAGRMVMGSTYGQPLLNSVQTARAVRLFAKYEF
ncbi:MAG: carboxypeptidase regulatory-like domain-containing protein [Rubrivivax sp.]|nr:carboxypeptidase regulatory-like domain-containing protein [Rubrivivax sp.]